MARNTFVDPGSRQVEGTIRPSAVIRQLRAAPQSCDSLVCPCQKDSKNDQYISLPLLRRPLQAATIRLGILTASLEASRKMTESTG